MIDRPLCSLTFRQAAHDGVVGDETTARRVRALLVRYRESCPLRYRPPACCITLKSTIPEHHGLGSGTQLSLALVRGLSWLGGEEDVDVAELARRVGRGRRSAVGIHGFREGGLVVEAGMRTSDDIGPLAVRLPLPDDWRVLLINPPESGSGLSGAVEERAFDGLGSMPMATSERLSRIVLSELLPAVQTSDFDEFSAAVFEYGRLAGEFLCIDPGRSVRPSADRPPRRMVAGAPGAWVGADVVGPDGFCVRA